jgi:hypothetical protein
MVLVTALGSWVKTFPCGHLGFKNHAAQSELVSALRAKMVPTLTHQDIIRYIINIITSGLRYIINIITSGPA